MIRVWKGIEKEGIGSDSEIMTLFVCADKPLSFDFIRAVLEYNPEIKGIYFGAGRHEFRGLLPKDWDKLILYCEKRNMPIVIEVNPMMLEPFIHLYNHKLVTFIVAYYKVPLHINRLYFKTDDYAVTRIFTPGKNVDIKEVENDRYPDDILIYEEN